MGTTAGTPVPGSTPVKDDKGQSSTPSPQSPTPATTPPAIEAGQGVDTTGGVAGEGVPKAEFDRLSQVVREQQELTRALHLQNVELTRRLQSSQTPAAPVVTEEQANKDFFNQPVTATRQLIRDELQSIVAPLNARLELIAGDRRFDGVKTEFADIWQHIEGDVRSAVEVAQAQGNEVNGQLINVLALAAAGNYYRKNKGAINTSGGGNGNPPAPPSTDSRTVQQPINDPAFLRPSAPPRATSGGDTKPKREYTETELRLMRERSITPEKWDALLEASPSDFLTVELPKKGGSK